MMASGRHAPSGSGCCFVTVACLNFQLNFLTGSPVHRSSKSPTLLKTIRTLGAATVTVLALGGCEKVKSKLYPEAAPEVDQSWVRDSMTVAKGPPILFRAIKKGDQRLLIPIATLRDSKVSLLRMSKRGWNYLDIRAFAEGADITPVQNGSAGAPIKVQQRMWENSAAPLDSITGCPNMIPVIRAPLPAGLELAVMNYELPKGLKTMSDAQVSEALSRIPQLVTPTVGVRPAQLERYTRSVHQLLRKNGEPAVIAEYHDEAESSDTSVVGQRRPRHIVIVMEKGVYGYRPGWVYSTTGAYNDRPALRFLDSFDVDGDGNSEMFFRVEVPTGWSYTLAFKQRDGSWEEIWRRRGIQCDV